MPTTGEFLAHVLPDEGYLVAFVKGGKRKYNVCFDTLEKLEACIAEKNAQGLDVYHACASFQDPKGVYNERKKKRELRCHANAFHARSFWLDVDAGDGKPYPNAATAALAVQNFCDAAGLPTPLYVSSGHGAHIYWPLGQDIDAETWTRHARGLRQLCVRHALHVDPTRTADISSVLRPVGTQHHTALKPVVCGPLAGPYALADFEVLLDAAQETPPGPARSQPSAIPSIASQLATIYDNVPRYSDPIAAACEQLRLFKDSGGRIPEPLWYAGLGVLAFTEDGIQHGHGWSAGHPNYTAQETQERLDRARQLTGATTCEKFHALNPASCERCPHFGRIKSPIVLGTQAAVRPEEAASDQPQGISQTVTPAFLVDAQELESLPELPHDYAWAKSGALVLKSSNQKGDINIVISTYPIYLDNVQTGEVRGEYNYIFKQLIPEKGWVAIAMPAKTLFSAGGSSELADRGANIHDFSHFLRYVKHAVDKFYKEGAIELRYDQFGWKESENVFLYGHNLYAPDGVYNIVPGGELAIRSQWVGPSKTGELAGWTHAANSLFAAGCEAQSLALLASFAAPLMRFQAKDEGGAIISMVTRQTGTGKTTALVGAASVWGKREGLSLTNADTKISKFLTLGALGNLPVIYDEIEARDPAVIREFVINFTNGRDKMRSTRNGEIRHSASTWQTILISASNGSLVDALSTTSIAEAPSYRILEVPLVVPVHLKHAIGDDLTRQLNANYGHAGDAYLRWLTQPANLAWTQRALQQYTDQIWKTTQLKSDYRFWVRTAGAITVAAVIVKQLGLVEFSTERIIKWLLLRMTGGVLHNEDWAVTLLGEFFNAHTGNTIVMPGPFTPGARNIKPFIEPRKELGIRYEIQGQRYLIAGSMLREWLIKKETSFREFIADLTDKKIVTNMNKLVTLAGGTDIPSSRVLCVELDARHEKLNGMVPKVQDNVVPMQAAQ